jgi:hypothetical protein
MNTIIDLHGYTALPTYRDAAELAVKIAVDDEEGFYNTERAPNGMGWVVAVYDLDMRRMFYL